MKKILALLLAALMVGSMMTGCTKQEATSGEESAQTQQTESEAKEEPVEEETQASFTGAYIADPEYIKSKIGSEDVIFIDSRGADAAKKVPSRVQLQLHGSRLRAVQKELPAMRCGERSCHSISSVKS